MTVAKTAKPSAVRPTETIKEEVAAIRQESLESPAAPAAAELPFLGREPFAAAWKAGAAALPGYDEMMEFNKANIEALVASSGVVARGVQDLSKSIVSLAQDSFEDSMSAGKAFVGARTLKEFIDLSSSYAKANFDKLLSESARLSQLSTKVAEEALAPLNKRVEAAVERLTRPAA